MGEQPGESGQLFLVYRPPFFFRRQEKKRKSGKEGRREGVQKKWNGCQKRKKDGEKGHRFDENSAYVCLAPALPLLEISITKGGVSRCRRSSPRRGGDVALNSMNYRPKGDGGNTKWGICELKVSRDGDTVVSKSMPSNSGVRRTYSCVSIKKPSLLGCVS